MKKKSLKENTMSVKDSYSANESVNSAELAKVAKLVGGKDVIMKILDNPDLIDDHYEKLFDFYVSEMPYGTMKARDGDPYEWIYNRLDSLTSKKKMKNEEKLKEPHWRASMDTTINLRDIKKLSPEDKKTYDAMTPAQKKVFNELLKAITNPVREGSAISESKSLLKDTPEKEPEAKTEVNEATFTKQHYIAIANILKAAKTKDDIVNQLSAFFKKDNPLFDTAKFTAWIGTAQKPTSPAEEE